MRDSVSPSAPPLRPRDAIVPAVILLLLALVVLLQLNQPLFFFFNGAARQLPDGWWSHWTVLGAALVSVHLRRGGRSALLLVVATGGGLSRMAVGVHWPVDVLAGAAIGWLGACVGVAWAHRWRWGTTPRGQKWLAALLMLGAVVLLWGYDTGYPQAAWMQRVLAVLLLVLALPGFIGIWRRRPVLFEN